jgi:hypothetical protein
MSDEFVVEGFRVRLTSSLELVFEGSGVCCPDAARALAERYVEALRTRLPEGIFMLITMEEFLIRTTPPFGGMVRIVSQSREDRGRGARAVREARNELLAGADETLRRCYDYLQDASEEMNDPKGHLAYSVYKAMEVLEERFGSSEAKTIKALGSIFKKTKRAANEERHIQEGDQPRSNVSGRSVEFARETIRAYERYLLNPSS